MKEPGSETKVSKLYMLRLENGNRLVFPIAIC
jgi:hypothetical protein